MKIFDAHIHYFPDKIADKALEALTCPAYNIYPNTDGTLNGLLASMREAGVAFSMNLPVTTTPDAVDSVNKWAATNNKAPVFSLGSIHPDHPDPARALDDAAALGLKGVKMHPEFQAFRPEEERLRPIWETCARNNMVVYFHAGCDVNFPRPPRSSPASFAALKRKFPALKMVLAHMGGWEMWEEAAAELPGLDIFLDTSFTQGLWDADKLVSLIRRQGADKVLFGTDSPWRSQKDEIAALAALPLTDDEKRMILFDNAAKLFGVPL